MLQDLQNAPDQPVTVEGVQAIQQSLNLWVLPGSVPQQRVSSPRRSPPTSPTLYGRRFDELRVDVEDYIDGPNTVICAAHWQGQGKTSGISIDVHQFDLYEFREGRIVRAVLGFRSKDDALEAAGLRE